MKRVKPREVPTWAWIVLSGLAMGLAVALWRYASRRASLPCPHWLTPLLENPYMKLAAGSDLLLERARVRRGMRILDVGCGPGRLTLPAARAVGPEGEVVGLDLQAEMLEKLEARVHESGLSNVRLIRANAAEKVTAPESFDRAFLVAVLGEIPDRAGALRAIHETLRPGGLLSITEVLPDPHYQTRATVRSLAEKAGFRPLEGYGSALAFTLNFERPEEASP